MSFLSRMKQRFGNPAASSGSISPFADPAVRALRDAASDAQRSRLPQMAAALSYRTVFGLIPVLIVSLLLIRVLAPKDKQVEILKMALDRTGVSAISLRDDAPPSPEAPASSPAATTPNSAVPASNAPSEPSATAVEPKSTSDGGAADREREHKSPDAPKERGATSDHVSRRVTAALNSRSLSVEEWIHGMIEKADSTVSFKAIGVVGVATLIYAALAMLIEIERAFNQIYRVPRGRSLTRRVMNYWALLTLGSFGLMATFYVGAKFEHWADHAAESHGWIVGSSAVTVELIGYAITVVISTLMITLVYQTVPNTRVKPMSALLGALLAALLWEAGKFGFAQYVAYSKGYARIYGAVALIPLFLLWVYYTWLIVLFGLEVTYQLQYGRSKTGAQPLSDFGPAMIEPSACLVVMTAIARAMVTGTPQSVRALAHSTGLGEAVASLVVLRFAERGLLLRVASGGNHGDADAPRYALARTPGSIRVAEILALGFELAGGPEGNQVVARMRQAQLDAAGSETLADAAGLIGDAPMRSPNPPTISVQNPAESGPVGNGHASSSGSGAARPATL